MARYGQKFKDRAGARLLPSEGEAVELVAQEMVIGSGTLQRWREYVQFRSAQDACASPQSARQDRKRIKELERDCVIKAYSGCDDIQRLAALGD